MSIKYENRVRGTADFPVALYHNKADRANVQYHYHGEIELVYILKGGFKVTIGQKNYSAEKGDIFFINSGELHSMSDSREDVDFYSAVFHLKTLNFENANPFQKQIIAPLNNKQIVFPHKISIASTLYPKLKRQVERIFFTTNSFFREECLLALYEIALLFHKNNAFIVRTPSIESTHEINVIKDVSRYIHKNLSHRITLGELAGIAKMSPKYFCSFFKKQTGHTPFEFITSARIIRACELLENRELSITEISLECGFESPSYFTKTFKKQMRSSPREYRNAFFGEHDA